MFRDGDKHPPAAINLRQRRVLRAQTCEQNFLQLPFLQETLLLVVFTLRGAGRRTNMVRRQQTVWMKVASNRLETRTNAQLISKEQVLG